MSVLLESLIKALDDMNEQLKKEKSNKNFDCKQFAKTLSFKLEDYKETIDSSLKFSESSDRNEYAKLFKEIVEFADNKVTDAKDFVTIYNKLVKFKKLFTKLNTNEKIKHKLEETKRKPEDSKKRKINDVNTLPTSSNNTTLQDKKLNNTLSVITSKPIVNNNTNDKKKEINIVTNSSSSQLTQHPNDYVMEVFERPISSVNINSNNQLPKCNICNQVSLAQNDFLKCLNCSNIVHKSCIKDDESCIVTKFNTYYCRECFTFKAVCNKGYNIYVVDKNGKEYPLQLNQISSGKIDCPICDSKILLNNYYLHIHRLNYNILEGLGISAVVKDLDIEDNYNYDTIFIIHSPNQILKGIDQCLKQLPNDLASSIISNNTYSFLNWNSNTSDNNHKRNNSLVSYPVTIIRASSPQDAKSIGMYLRKQIINDQHFKIYFYVPSRTLVLNNIPQSYDRNNILKIKDNFKLTDKIETMVLAQNKNTGTKMALVTMKDCNEALKVKEQLGDIILKQGHLRVSFYVEKKSILTEEEEKKNYFTTIVKIANVPTQKNTYEIKDAIEEKKEMTTLKEFSFRETLTKEESIQTFGKKEAAFLFHFKDEDIAKQFQLNFNDMEVFGKHLRISLFYKQKKRFDENNKGQRYSNGQSKDNVHYGGRRSNSTGGNNNNFYYESNSSGRNHNSKLDRYYAKEEY